MLIADVPFEDVRLHFSISAQGEFVVPKELSDLRAAGALPFRMLPVLEVVRVTSGQPPLRIAQSKAIERYLARETGIAGATPAHVALLDAVCEQVADVKSALKAAKGDPAKRATFFAADLPGLFALIDKQLALVGGDDKINIADVYLYHLTHEFSKADAAELLAAATEGVKKAVEKVATHPRVVAWEAARPSRKETF